MLIIIIIIKIMMMILTVKAAVKQIKLILNSHHKLINHLKSIFNSILKISCKKQTVGKKTDKKELLF